MDYIWNNRKIEIIQKPKNKAYFLLIRDMESNECFLIPSHSVVSKGKDHDSTRIKRNLPTD